jgi:hypothetical protein
MSSARVNYTPRPDTTSNIEVNALAAIYRFILFETNASKRAARPTAPTEAKGPESDRPAERILPQ